MREEVRTCLGMTPPISLDEPTPSDLERTRELKEYLRMYDMYETDSELNKRLVVIVQYSLLLRYNKISLS